ncbi:MAG TPA: phosphoribosylaminoimidazolesuccinocarboxamide synthase [bacterium]
MNMLSGSMAGHPAPSIADTALPLPLYRRGKVRDVYEAGGNLLIVATDRISAYDHILATSIPDKGRVLTQLSAFWFERTRGIAPNHMLSVEVQQIARAAPQLGSHLRMLAGRSMLVRRCERIDVECVVRGYLAGSGWEEYRRNKTLAGITLPAGLQQGSPLPEPMFTPATKASSGHDENITYSQLIGLVGEGAARELRDCSVALYKFAASHATSRGLILADTKFEFGRHDGQLVLIDEALTPDSSRYWDATAYPQSLVAFDKQFVRDHLNEIGWNREPPAPSLPTSVVEATRERYIQTYRQLTGRELSSHGAEVSA